MFQKSFDLTKVVFTIDGVPITGFQDGDAIVIKADADLWSKTVGADGEVVRSRVNNPAGSVDVNLLYSSMSNSYLNTIKALDRALGQGTVAMQVVDLASGTTVIVPQAWVKRQPDITFGREAGPRTWTMDASRIEVVDRGIPGFGGRIV